MTVPDQVGYELHFEESTACVSVAKPETILITSVKLEFFKTKLKEKTLKKKNSFFQNFIFYFNLC